MRVVQFIAASGPGGIEQVAFDYSYSMKKLGIECITIAKLPTQQIKKYDEYGLKIINNINSSNFFSFISFFKYKKIFSEQNISVIIDHIGRNIKLTKFISPKIPVISVTHTYNLKHRIHADAIISINSKIHSEVSKFYQKKSYLIPNPLSINGSPILKYNDFFNKKSNDFVIGVMGQHVKHKGYDYFLHSLKILKEKGISFKCLFAGDGVERKALENISYKNGLSENVEFIGWVYDKRSFYEKIDLFCLPSISEPFGLVVTEAMSFGKPVIATNTDGPSDIIRHGIDGIIVPSCDQIAFAKALEFFISNRSSLMKMGYLAYCRAHNCFSHEKIGKLLYEAFTDLCKFS